MLRATLDSLIDMNWGNNRMVKHWVFFGISLVFVMHIGPSVLAQAGSVAGSADSTVGIQNEFIKVVVNNQDEDKGRFAIETTGGDPKNPLSKNQSLIFGRPIPWTSYTTVLIDDKAYVFGGINKKMAKRAGKNFEFGHVSHQTLTQDGVVITECLFGAVRVRQKLSIVRNPLTGIKDTGLIQYDVDNQDNASHTVGLRLMVDTKLGLNDGAPFRIGSQSVESERRFSGDQVQDFWQAFDQLLSPNVVAQGTVSLLEKGVYPPHELLLANWGTLADYPWHFPYEEGRSFVRDGEEEKDTALAMWWEPVTLAPAQEHVIKTLYGLGGLSVSKGALSLGLASPEKVYATSKKEVLVVGYLSNTSSYEARDVELSFVLPEGLTLSSGALKTTIDVLPSGYTKQIPIKLKTDGKAFGNQTLKFSVTSSTFDSNQISRPIYIFGAPELQVDMRCAQRVVVSENFYVTVAVDVQNKSVLPVENVAIHLNTDSILEIPRFELPTRVLSKISPQQSQTVTWKVKVARPGNRESILSATVASPVTLPKTVSHKVMLNVVTQDIRLTSSQEDVMVGEYLYVAPVAHYVDPFFDRSWRISWDPNQVQMVRFSPDEWMISQEDNHVSLSSEMQFLHYRLVQGKKENRFGKLRFKALRPGLSDIVLWEKGQAYPVQVNIIPTQNLVQKEGRK